MPNCSRSSQLSPVTNWCVITGAPCSGKTSVIESLHDLGHRVVTETERAYIDRQLGRGETLETIKADPLAFERHLLMKKVAIEQALPQKQRIYLDRAVPDSIAYYQIEGLDPREPKQLSRAVHYRKIFLFEQLPFEQDSVRAENHQLASRIEQLLEACYTALGYRLIRVPVMTVARRVAFVIRHSAAG